MRGDSRNSGLDLRFPAAAPERTMEPVGYADGAQQSQPRGPHGMQGDAVIACKHREFGGSAFASLAICP